MNRFFILTASLSIMVFMGCSEKKDTHQMESTATTQEKKMADTEGKVFYYTCPMESHKHVHSDKPGDCPECGMKLVAAVGAEMASVEYYGCPMPTHSHIRHDKAGKCEECGMDLKPMRLKK